MRLRHAVVLAGIAGALAVPFATAGEGGQPVSSASGGVHWTVPADVFGIEIANQPLAFNARKYADGSVSGRFEYHQVGGGESFNFNVDVTCMNVYDGNRAKIGGEIKVSNDPTIPPGTFAWFQVFDNGEGADASPDRSSLIGFGNEPRTTRFATAPHCRVLGRGMLWATCRSDRSSPPRVGASPPEPRRPPQAASSFSQ